MRNSHCLSRIIAIIACYLLAPAPSSLGTKEKKTSPIDTAKIEQITGLKGGWNQEEGVFKVTSPRIDIKVSVDNWAMPPFMGLTSWAAFSRGRSKGFMVMGDLVLFQDEVNPVMSALLESGLEVTALHNHFFYEDPKVYFMHLAGEGSLDTLASGVRKALERVKAVRAATSIPAKGFGEKALPETSSLTVKTLEDTFGMKGQSQNGMVKFVIGRTVTMACDCVAGKDMGVNTWAAFAGGDDNAVVDGDFAVHESELQSVLKSLRRSGVNVVAIHHHMSQEKPRILFLHYWGRGTADTLAKGLKAAINLTSHK